MRARTRRPSCKHKVYSLQFTVYGLRFTIPGRALELRLPGPVALAVPAPAAARGLHCAAVAQTDTLSFSLSACSVVCFPVCLPVGSSVSWLLAQRANLLLPAAAACRVAPHKL